MTKLALHNSKKGWPRSTGYSKWGKDLDYISYINKNPFQVYYTTKCER